jgi:hypothetical protein
MTRRLWLSLHNQKWLDERSEGLGETGSWAAFPKHQLLNQFPLQYQRRQLLTHCGRCDPTSFRDESSDLTFPGVIAPRKPLFHVRSVLRFAVLAHLPLGVNPGDGQPHTDDATQLRLDEVGWSIADGPRPGARRLVKIGQARDDIEQAVGILEELDRAIDVDS